MILFLNSCASLELLEKKPEVTFKDIKILSFNLQNVDLDVSYEINNPYTFEVLLQSISYALKIEGNEILKSELNLDKTIPANQISPLNMRLHLPYTSIGKLINELISKKEIKTHLDGIAKLGFPKNLNLTESFNIPFIYDENVQIINH
jgi:LEA14-like dessication related protein